VRPPRGCCLALLLLVAAVAVADERVLKPASGEVIRYRLVDAAMPSARQTAERLLRHLAAGDIAEAAQLSNAPRRRFEELASYRERVGEEEFKRVFGQYLEGRVVVDAAIDAHRLLVWKLGESALAGQYYVQVDGRFLMDDVPNATRTQLQRVLEAYRAGRLRFSE